MSGGYLGFDPKKFTLVSPIFTGAPTSPTPPQFNNTERLATTEFVHRALGNLQAQLNVGTNTALTAADVGKVVVMTAPGLTITLPLSSGVLPGCIVYVNANGQGGTVSASGSDQLTRPDNSTGSVTLNAIDFAVFRRTGIGWTLENSPAALKYMTPIFGSALAANGYQKLPSGLIIQWGSGTGSGAHTLTWPIAFPNGFLHAVGAVTSSTPVQLMFYVNRAACTTTTGAFVGSSTAGSATTVNYTYIAIGH